MAIIRVRRKHSPIVAIAAHAKINPGDALISVDNGFVEHLIITSRPYWVSYKTFPGGSWWIDYEDLDGTKRRESLGDCGWPGFHYDDRPCRWLRDEKDALARIHEIESWHQNRDYFDAPICDYDY